MQELMIAEKKYQVIELPGRPKALLDRTVAEIYEVETRRVNEAVSRNPEKFPADFCFELIEDEKKELVANCDRFESLKHSTVLPKAFTWEGCNMLATILQSDVAIQRSIQIVRGFTAVEKGIAQGKGASKVVTLFNLNREWQAAIKMLKLAGKNKPTAMIDGAKLVEQKLGENPYTVMGIEPPVVVDVISTNSTSSTLDRILAWTKRKGLSLLKPRDLHRSGIPGCVPTSEAKAQMQALVDGGMAHWVESGKVLRIL